MRLKLIPIALIIAIVLNLALFVFGMVGQFLFWITIIIIAIIAYRVLPKLRDKKKV